MYRTYIQGSQINSSICRSNKYHVRLEEMYATKQKRDILDIVKLQRTVDAQIEVSKVYTSPSVQAYPLSHCARAHPRRESQLLLVRALP